MGPDPIVDEIRRAREEVVAPFSENIHEFFEYIRQRERQSDATFVTLPPNPPDPVIGTFATR